MCMRSEEGNADCLGIFPTEVKRFIPQKHEDKVPHMGWNTLTNVKSGLFNERLENKFVYFVHSYYVPVNEYTAATTDYILPFSAALHKDNFSRHSSIRKKWIGRRGYIEKLLKI